MGLEKRGNNYYYYEKERDGGKVRSVYLGKSETARLFQELNFWRKLEAEEERQRKSSEREQELKTEAELDSAVEAVCEMGEIMTIAFYLTNEFHQHKRQWRKQRKIKAD